MQKGFLPATASLPKTRSGKVKFKSPTPSKNYDLEFPKLDISAGKGKTLEPSPYAHITLPDHLLQLLAPKTSPAIDASLLEQPVNPLLSTLNPSTTTGAAATLVASHPVGPDLSHVPPASSVSMPLPTVSADVGDMRLTGKQNVAKLGQSSVAKPVISGTASNVKSVHADFQTKPPEAWTALFKQKPRNAGGTMVAAIDLLKERGVTNKQIKVISAIAAPPPLAKINKKFPGLCVYTAMIDPVVNDKGWIIPGLGDAGDRSFGTEK